MLSVVCNGQETNAPFTGDAVINGTNGPVKVQFMTFAAHQSLGGAPYTFYVILRNPETGFTWWIGLGSSSSQSDQPDEVASWKMNWRNNFWIVPQFGILRISSDVLKYKMKSESLEEARQELLDGSASGQENDLWPLEKHMEAISLYNLLGTNFVSDPRLPMFSPPPKVRQVGFDDGVLTIELESSIRTNLTATIELDSNLKVPKATSSEK